MAVRTETLEYGNFDNPTGLPVASIAVAFTGAVSADTVTQMLPPGTATVTVTLNPDTYVFTAQAMDATGAPIGPPATDTFTIGSTTTLTVQIPILATGVTTTPIVTPPTVVPNAPVIGTATAGSGSALVSFTPGATDVTNAAASYSVVSAPGGLVGVGSVSPIRVKGLTQGTVYTFTVTAINAVGAGSPSAASNPVTPVATAVVPDAPIIGTATDGPTSAVVSFTPPVNTGGSPILDYSVMSSPGGITVVGAASPITVTGLTTGTPYIFTVTARNTAGMSPPSAGSNVITPA